MKYIYLSILLSAGTSIVNASEWREEVRCTIERWDVDSQKSYFEILSKKLIMNGSHNGENGSVSFDSKLALNYSFKYEKFSGGRNEIASLQSLFNKTKTMALSSVDLSKEKNQISNKFTTKDGGSQLTVTCSSLILTGEL